MHHSDEENRMKCRPFRQNNILPPQWLYDCTVLPPDESILSFMRSFGWLQTALIPRYRADWLAGPYGPFLTVISGKAYPPHRLGLISSPPLLQPSFSFLHFPFLIQFPSPPKVAAKSSHVLGNGVSFAHSVVGLERGCPVESHKLKLCGFNVALLYWSVKSCVF